MPVSDRQWVLRLGEWDYHLSPKIHDETFLDGYRTALSDVVSEINRHYQNRPFCILENRVKHKGG